jgi:hypothetical protein
MSCDRILDSLQKTIGRDLTPQSHPVKSLILERFKTQPAPQTVVSSEGRSAGASPDTAAIAVFNISELLESILSHLSMEDLLVSSRVNKAFNRLVAASPTLQRKMFLLPEKTRPQQ